MVFILNGEAFHIDIRQMSGLTLKSLLERNFKLISQEDLNYLKQNILSNYLHSNQKIRTTVSIIINTFIKQGGLEIWPELLIHLENSLNSDYGAETALETFHLVIEDSGELLQNKFQNFLDNLIPKLIGPLENLKSMSYPNEKLISLILMCIESLVENCYETMENYLEKSVNVLLQMNSITNVSIRYKLGRVWVNLIKVNSSALSFLFNNLFEFFLNNLKEEHYEMNFNASDFFNYVLEEDTKMYKDESVMKVFDENLHMYLF